MSPVSLWAINFVSHNTYVGIDSPVKVKKETLAGPVNGGPGLLHFQSTSTTSLLI